MPDSPERLPPGQGVTRAWPVLHVGSVPAFDPTTWCLRVHGEVSRPVSLTWPDFQALPQVEERADFHCVTGWSRLGHSWTGVRLADLAARVGILESARFVRFADPQGYDTSVPRAIALDPLVLLVQRCDGVPLAPEHGAPLRAFVPARYAWKGCKWLVEIEFQARERLGYWEVRGYHNGADPWLEERMV